MTQSVLMRVGGVAAVAGAIALTAIAISQRKWRVLLAIAFALVGIAMLQVVFYMDANDSWVVEQEVVDGDTTTTTVIDSSTFRVPTATVGLLASMGGICWFLLACWRGASIKVRSIVFLTGVGGVYFLAGLTPIDRVQVPAPFLILTVIAILAAVFLNFTIYGRYLLALGNNEEAARYSGINTKAMIIMAYVICAMMAGIAGVLFALDINSIQPSSHGNFYELYAIAAAVLGGCSLRGGEGSILGVVIGAAVMRVLYNAINMLGIPTQLEFAIIGAVILFGVVVDEIFKHVAERRARVGIEKSS